MHEWNDLRRLEALYQLLCCSVYLVVEVLQLREIKEWTNIQPELTYAKILSNNPARSSFKIRFVWVEPDASVPSFKFS
jgi:hypothetical protein